MLAGALGRFRQIAGGDDGGLQKAGSEPHQGDHLVTTGLRSEYIAALKQRRHSPDGQLEPAANLKLISHSEGESAWTARCIHYRRPPQRQAKWPWLPAALADAPTTDLKKCRRAFC